MPGVKGRSGRKRNPRNAQRYFNDKFDGSLFELTAKLIKKALEGDREMLIYCFDRRLGKPKQSTELDISGGEELTAGLVTQLFAMLAAKRKEFEQGYVEIENTGGEDGQDSQGTDAEIP